MWLEAGYEVGHCELKVSAAIHIEVQITMLLVAKVCQTADGSLPWVT